MSAHFESCPVIAPQNTSCDANAHHSAPVIVLAAGVHACMLPCVVCKCLQVSFRDFVTLQGTEEELRFQRLRTLHVSGVASLTA